MSSQGNPKSDLLLKGKKYGKAWQGVTVEQVKIQVEKCQQEKGVENREVSTRDHPSRTDDIGEGRLLSSLGLSNMNYMRFSWR